MRLPILALLALAGCDRNDGNAGVPVEAAQTEDGKVECALRGATEFRRDCALDRAMTKGGLTLTIRAPDGGFRRLLVTRDGRGVVAADGAEPAAVTVVGDRMIEVAIASDRYRLPATIE